MPLPIAKPPGANIGIMEKKMEITILYWGYIGIVEKELETTILGLGFRV